MLKGEEDPAQALIKSSLTWGGTRASGFREVKIPHVVNADLCLPTLYLHFLDARFRTQRGGLDNALRAGNDNSEVIIKIDTGFLSDSFASRCEDCTDAVQIVIQALKAQGELFIDSCSNNPLQVTPGVLYFSLKTARPKAGISLPKKLFGIPESAELYLFVNNHASVTHFDDEVKEAFTTCIGQLPESNSADAKLFATFLKVFYEGGFGYNEKHSTSGTSYLPVNVGVAAMSVVPAFEGQLGIGTGYPYALPGAFLSFVDTVPISIEAICSMSDRHGRYGLAFTRTVFVWEGDKWESSKILDFASILPHGGFYYVPALMKDHALKGGFVYAFGESKDDNVEGVNE